MQNQLRQRGQTLPPKKLFVMATVCIAVCDRLIPEPLLQQRGSPYPCALLRAPMVCFILNLCHTGHKIPCSRTGKKEHLCISPPYILHDLCSLGAQFQQRTCPQPQDATASVFSFLLPRLTICDSTPFQK